MEEFSVTMVEEEKITREFLFNSEKVEDGQRKKYYKHKTGAVVWSKLVSVLFVSGLESQSQLYVVYGWQGSSARPYGVRTRVSW